MPRFLRVDELMTWLPLGLPGAEHMVQSPDSFPRAEAGSPHSKPDFPGVPEVRRGTIERTDPLGSPLWMFPCAFLAILAGSILKLFPCASCGVRAAVFHTFHTLLLSDGAFKSFQNKNTKNKTSCGRSARWSGFFPGLLPVKDYFPLAKRPCSPISSPCAQR